MVVKKTTYLVNCFETGVLPRILKDLGLNMKLAQKRRKLTREQVAGRAGIAPSTLQLIEGGNPGVAMSSYLQELINKKK